MDPEDFKDALHDLRGECETWGQAYVGMTAYGSAESCAAEADRLEKELLGAYRHLWDGIEKIAAELEREVNPEIFDIAAHLRELLRSEQPAG